MVLLRKLITSPPPGGGCHLWTFPAGLLIMSGLVAIATIADGIGLIVDWGVIKRRNLLLCRVMRPDSFNLTLYCLCQSTSTMVAALWQQILFFLLSVIYSNYWSYIELIKYMYFSIEFSFKVFVTIWIILLTLQI